MTETREDKELFHASHCPEVNYQHSFHSATKTNTKPLEVNTPQPSATPA